MKTRRKTMDGTTKAHLQTVLMTMVFGTMGGGGSEGGGRNMLWMFLIYVLVTSSETVIERFNNFVKRYIFKHEELTYTLRSSITFNKGIINSNDVSQQFKAIMTDVIERVKQSKVDIKYKIENRIYNYRCDTFPFMHFESKRDFISVGNGLFINIKKDTKKGSDTNIVSYKIRVKHVRNDMDTCINYVESCVEKYAAETQNSLKHQHVFLLTDIKGENRELVFSKIRFDVSKSFDNLFFAQKNELMDKLDYFMGNESRYRMLGMPYTLGFLFHGAPGTGKTSAIKAIANYTKRHIVSISLKNIQTIDDLRSMFYDTKINDICVPHNRRLYVFEEIDCGQWGKIIAKRQGVCVGVGGGMNGGESGGGGDSQDVVTIMGPESKVAAVEKKTKQDINITLGELLELLDGVVEISGRMIIMTTNHPEKLDPALTRPGRIDMTIEFKKMTRSDVAQMYELWYAEKLPKHIYNNMKDYTFTQADLGYIFSKNTKHGAQNALC